MIAVEEVLDTAQAVVESYATFDKAGNRVIPEHVVFNLIMALKGDKDALAAWTWRVSQAFS